MIFYFSGTGNSRWAAQRIAALTADRAADLCSSSAEESMMQEKRIGIVFPVYAWGLPEPVSTFAEKMQKGNAFTYGIATCGEEAGKSLDQLNRLFPLDSRYSLIMPSNYTIGEDLEEPEVIRAKFRTAEKQLEEMAAEILASEHIRRVHEGKLSWLKSHAVHPAFNRFARRTGPFHVLESCIGCGLCAEVCPAGTISMKNGRPVWGSHCYQCLRCLHRCPQNAIRYGDKMNGRKQYRIEEYLPENTGADAEYEQKKMGGTK